MAPLTKGDEVLIALKERIRTQELIISEQRLQIEQLTKLVKTQRRLMDKAGVLVMDT